MFIVNCKGGLGNQMFQYAFYKSLGKGGAKTKLYIGDFDIEQMHNGFELDKIFAISDNYATKQDRDNLAKNGILFKILRKLKLYNSYYIERDFSYNNNYLKYTGNCFFDGYWQSEKYFSNCMDEIRHDFEFPALDHKNMLIAKEIELVNSVSIHVRMGDYVNHPLHGGICTLEYYKKAIESIHTKITNPVFYIFSNNISWCQQNLSLPNAIYVMGNEEKNSYKDMYLMSLCKHNIIANSSFSWWGAWLNSNPNKMVIAPKKWFNDPKMNTKDLIPEKWYKI